jgi:Carboxypeptidase regulatory-like domain
MRTMKLHYLFLIIAILGPLAFAQTPTTGVVLGTVSDKTGAVVAAAKVELVDRSSNIHRSGTTNSAGQYTFLSLQPGDYEITVTAPGFGPVIVPVRIEVAKSTLGNVILELGSVTQAVEVSGVAVELQSTDSSVGDVVGGGTIERLPTIQRRVAELAYLQVGAQPIAATGGYNRGGGIAGARPDQNTFTLDGIDITDPEEGGIYGQIGPGMPLPVEAVEEFRGTVTNPNASFGRVSGGQFAFSTRHGSSDFHGAAYWYHQNEAFDANTWTRNFLGEAKPTLRDNRFGARIGGPIVKGKTFFFGFYEGRRFPQSTDVVRLVPSESFRSGILRFRDGQDNIVSYDLATSASCGPTSSAPCDPRGIGISPTISQLMTQYPIGNSAGDGDGLNTIGFRGATDTSQRNDFALLRLDHNLSKYWHTNGSFIYSRERVKDPYQVEIDPALTAGKPFKTLGGLPNDGRVVNVSLTGQPTPNSVTDIRLGWTQTGIPLDRELARTQISSAGTALDLGDSGGDRLLDSPGDVSGGLARPQFGREHVWHIVANQSWLKGRHSIQAGVNFQHLHFHHTRVDKLDITIVPVASLTAGNFLAIPAAQRPPTCTGLQSNCLLPGDQSRWDTLYAGTLGMIDNVAYFTTRDAEGRPNPPLTPNIADVTWRHLELYGSDTFRVTPSFTLSYGLNFSFETPVTDTNERQAFLTDNSTGQPISPRHYLAQKEAAAIQGHIFNPVVAFSPAAAFHRGIYPNQANVAPRLAAAWSPSYRSGLRGAIFGEHETVLRGGYALVFERINAVSPVEYPLIGNELAGGTNLLQAPLNSQGQPYRVGVDGPVPVPLPAATIPIPFVPSSRNIQLGTNFGIGKATGFDPDYKVGRIHSANLTLQRALKSEIVVETGWIGRYGRNLPMAVNLNGVPVFIKDMSGLSNQTFAQAFDGVAAQLREGIIPGSVNPQPWFENNLGPGGTVALASAGASDFISGGVGSLFRNHIDPALQGGAAQPVLSQQFRNFYFATTGGWSNYNALFASLRKRMTAGLSVTVNYTWSHSLDTGGSVQDDQGGALTNSYSPRFDYGDSLTDRRHSLTGYGMYELPFARNKRIGGWYISGIFSAYTGLPISITQDGDVFGGSAGIESVPVKPGTHFSEGLHYGVAGSGGVGTAGDPSTGGTGLNLFSNPQAVFNSLRPFLISQDRRTARGSFRDLGWWNFDCSVGKTTAITERAKLTFSVDFFNLFNHPVFEVPSSMSLLDPAGFGVITQQAGSPSAGDFAGPRRIQVGARLEF